MQCTSFAKHCLVKIWKISKSIHFSTATLPSLPCGAGQARQNMVCPLVRHGSPLSRVFLTCGRLAYGCFQPPNDAFVIFGLVRHKTARAVLHPVRPDHAIPPAPAYEIQWTVAKKAIERLGIIRRVTGKILARDIAKKTKRGGHGFSPGGRSGTRPIILHIQNII